MILDHFNVTPTYLVLPLLTHVGLMGASIPEGKLPGKKPFPSPPSRKIGTTLNMHLKTKKEDIELRK